jgi:hypothetical protein
MLWNDTNTGMVLRAREAQDAAAKLGVTIQSERRVVLNKHLIVRDIA